MNYIEQYYNEITSGKVTVSKKVKRVYKHLVDKIKNPQGVYYFDEDKASRVITFIETFCHSPDNSRETLKLELWQKAFLSALFGFIDSEGKRQYRETIMIVGRKNGKSALSAAIALYMLIADGESAPEIYAVSTTAYNAKHLWQYGVLMSKYSAEIKPYINKHVADISCLINDGIFKPLASEDHNLDGLNVSCAIMDEIHEWKNDNLYHVVVDGTASRKQPLTVIITTAGFVRACIFDKKYEQAKKIIDGYDNLPGGYTDDRILPVVYELDDKEEWRDEKCWQKANPALGTIKDYQRLAQEVYRCKNGTGNPKNLLTKDFDIPETGSESYLDWQDIVNKEAFDPLIMKPRYGIGGFDLSRTTDLTSACVIFRVPDDERIYVLTMSWITENALEQREREDKVPYKKWIEKDYLRVCPGGLIDYHMVADWFAEVQEKYDIYMYKIGYDSYGAGYLTQEMSDTYGAETLETVIQGAKTLSIPLQNLRAELKAKHIIYGNNPIMAWCLANLRVKQDINGNYQPCKNRSDKTRDDAAMAMLDAYTVYLRNMEDYLNII